MKKWFLNELDKDVKIIVTGESPTRLAALRAGSIDASAIDIAFAVKAEDEGFRRFLYLGDIIQLPLSAIDVMRANCKISVIRSNGSCAPRSGAHAS